ncbi:MAG: hypothetical protein HY660_08860 [Armatimonadetes bacterium]|nr:hypothetical protein [Armatimonadota bacterium]
MAPEFLSYTIEQLVPLFQTGQLSPLEVTRACLDRIAALNPTLQAYTAVLAEQALEDARQAERALARREARSPLQGVPVSVKDVFQTRDAPTTWGAADLAGYHTGHDATVVDGLRRAGAVLLGKANPDVYPYHGSARSPRLIGPSRNPWDPERTAGRSSGGSAAGVAARLAYGSVGSDTGGSIRIPAAFSGVVGLKPTFGLVSNYRVFPYSKSFDCCGPLARSVYDCALLLGAVAGHDPEDPTTVDRPAADYLRGLDGSVRGVRVGVPRAAAWEGNDPEVTRLVDDAVAVLAAQGMVMQDIDLPDLHQGRWGRVVSAMETIEMADALGTPAPSDPYAAHMRERAVLARTEILSLAQEVFRPMRLRYIGIFREVDVIALPTIAITAPRLSEEQSPWQRAGETLTELVARYLRIFNILGYPAISVPCGFSAGGLPVGLQIAGRPFEEALVLRAARAYERATDWHLRHPV